MKTIDRIRELLAEGETEEAIQLLVKYTKETSSPHYNDAVLLSGQYKQWRRETSLGVKQSSNDLRRIEMSIMDIVDEKSKAAPQPTEAPVNTPPPRQKVDPKPVPPPSNNKRMGYIIGGVILLLLVIGFFALSGDGDDFDDDPMSAIEAESMVPSSDDGITETEDIVNGETVQTVTFANARDEYQGQFIHIGNGVWNEEGANGEVRFSYSEELRDEWSVYLHDENRKTDIQLDLYSGEIKYKDGTNPEYRTIYKISEWTD